MNLLYIAATNLGWLCLTALLLWFVSLVKRDVSIVDAFWPIFFVVVAANTFLLVDEPTTRTSIVIVLTLGWALRLSGYITWRNWGKQEDFRYQEIRARNTPNFAVKSLFIIFLFQAVLAWLVSLTLLGALTGAMQLSILDYVGLILCATGIAFETIGDYQLARFKANPENKNKVMDRGLWKYTRHPNYFGDFCVWWGFYLFAISAGAWWTLPGPVVMTVLLLKVSGVSLLEKDIGKRRPGYAEYVARTNVFFPGPPKNKPLAGTMK